MSVLNLFTAFLAVLLRKLYPTTAKRVHWFHNPKIFSIFVRFLLFNGRKGEQNRFFYHYFTLTT